MQSIEFSVSSTQPNFRLKYFRLFFSLAHRFSLCGSGLLFGLVCLGFGCSESTCPIATIEVTYAYDTSCVDIGPRRGKLTWSIPSQSSTPQAVERELLQQTQKTGLLVEEIVLVWDFPRCPETSNGSSATTQTPLRVLNIQRIVLAPDDGSGETVQRLLACEPIGSQPPNTLTTRFLLACHTGQNSGNRCTFSLEPSTP